MNKEADLSTDEQEISIIDIINFLKEAWKLIASTTLVGLVAGILFIVFIPRQYEARAQIQMAKLQDPSNAMGVGVESPGLLMARLRSPSIYDDQQLQACDLIGQKNPREHLAKDVINIVQPKGLDILELRIEADSQEKAQVCLMSVFEKIKNTQNEIQEPLLKEAHQKISIYEARLKEVKEVLTRSNGSQATLGTYLSSRDEIKEITDQLMKLQDFITSSENRPAKMIAPVYITNEPVFPKKGLTLIISVLIGLFFGIFTSLVLRFIKNNQ